MSLMSNPQFVGSNYFNRWSGTMLTRNGKYILRLLQIFGPWAFSSDLMKLIPVVPTIGHHCSCGNLNSWWYRGITRHNADYTATHVATVEYLPIIGYTDQKKNHLACWIWRYITWLFETTQIKWAAMGICWHKLNKTLARILNYTNIVIWDVDTHPRCKSRGVGELMIRNERTVTSQTLSILVLSFYINVVLMFSGWRECIHPSMPSIRF